MGVEPLINFHPRVFFTSSAPLGGRLSPLWSRLLTTSSFRNTRIRSVERAISVPLLQFARYCSIVQTLSHIRVAILRLHDVIGRLTTLCIFNLKIGKNSQPARQTPPPGMGNSSPHPTPHSRSPRTFDLLLFSVNSNWLLLRRADRTTLDVVWNSPAAC